MGKRHHSHRPASTLAAILTAIFFAIGSLASALGQTRIISLSGDLDFGRIPLHASSQRALAISNLGDSVLTISNLVFSPPPTLAPAPFHGEFSGQLYPGVSVFVPITFTPLGTNPNGGTNDADFQGSVTVNSDATGGTNTALLSGIGTYPPVSPSVHLDFGKVPMGSSRAMTLLLTNIGTVPVTISNVVLPRGFLYYFGPPITNAGGNGFGGGGGGGPRGGGGGGGFGSFLPLGPTLAPGTATNLNVYFAPSSIGSGNSFDVVTVSSDATNPVWVLVTPEGNATNSDVGLTVFTVSGTGTYPSGKYVGLFMPPDHPAFENSGYFTADSAARGKLRATLTLAGKRYPFSAQISASGAVSATIERKNLPALNISLQFGLFRGWTGTIGDGTWTANLLAHEAPLPSKNALHVVPSGNYTFTIAGDTNSLASPTAPGTGNLDIKNSYATRVTGTLGDGTRYSQNTILCFSQIPFYASLYGNRGAILGWIFFQYVPPPPTEIDVPIIEIPRQTNSPVWPSFPPPTTVPVVIVEQTNPPPVISIPTNPPIQILSGRSNQLPLEIVGTLHWFKPGGIDTNYPDGFSFQTTVSGSVP